MSPANGSLGQSVEWDIKDAESSYAGTPPSSVSQAAATSGFSTPITAASAPVATPSRAKKRTPAHAARHGLPTFRRSEPLFSWLRSRKPSIELLSEEAELRKQIEAIELNQNFVVATGALKGGVGKTTTTGNVAILTGDIKNDDRLLVIDANSDPGSIEDIMPLKRSGLNLREMAEFLSGLEGRELTWVDLKNRIAVTKRHGGIAVLPSRYSIAGSDESDLDSTPNRDSMEKQSKFGERELATVVDKLHVHFNLTFLDLGLNLLHPITRGALKKADLLELVTEPTFTSFNRLIEAKNGLLMQGEKPALLARNAIIVINNVRPELEVSKEAMTPGERKEQRIVSVTDIQRVFSDHHVMIIPNDLHIESYESVNFDQYQLETRIGYSRLSLRILQQLVGSAKQT